MTRKILVLMLLMGMDPASSGLSAASPPCPRRPGIEGIAWDVDTLVTAAPGGDLWPATWGADGHIYTSWGDGGGFGGTTRTCQPPRICHPFSTSTHSESGSPLGGLVAA